MVHAATAPPPGSRWLATPAGHPPAAAVVERTNPAGTVLFWETSQVSRRTGRGRKAKRRHLPLPLFLARYAPLHERGPR
jgi:hypothetical protein